MPKVVPEYREDAKRRIIEAAMDVIAERGSERMRIDDVAQKLGVTKGAVYWYFKSKEELISAVLDKIRSDVQKVEFESYYNRSFEETLMQMYDRYPLTDDRQRAIFFEAFALATRNTEVRHATREYYEGLASTFETVIRKEKKAAFSPDAGRRQDAGPPDGRPLLRAPELPPGLDAPEGDPRPLAGRDPDPAQARRRSGRTAKRSRSPFWRACRPRPGNSAPHRRRRINPGAPSAGSTASLSARPCRRRPPGPPHRPARHAAGRVKEKVEPSPGVDSTHTFPPCRSTIFLTTASPIPVPSYSSWVWRRWNISKIRSKYPGSIPIPLSCDRELHHRAHPPAVTGSRAGSPGAGI